MKAKIVCELAITALLFMSQGSKAQESSKNDDWLLFAEGGNINAYFHTPTLKLQNGYVRAWVLYSNKNAMPNKDEKHLSSKLLIFYDCDNDNFSLRAIIQHAETMGKGPILYHEDIQPPARWYNLIPESLNHIAHEFMCTTALSILKK